MAFNKGEWRPNPKQAEFLAIPWTIKEAAYAGGAGSGKSDVLLMYPIVHKLHEHPAFKQVFMRRTFPELRNEIVPRSREIYRQFGASFNKSDMAWTFPRLDQFGTGVGHSNNGGAIVYLAHCEDESDVHKYDSMEINLYSPDEITSFTEYIYLYIALTRVRTSYPELPAITRAAGMPGGIGHTFVKKRFVDPYPKGGKIIVGKGGNKRVYIHATLADNKHIDPAYSQSLEGLPEAEKNAKKYGDWDAYLGQVFEEFRDKKYPDEPENALHVIEPFVIPQYWVKILIGDWGFRAMTWLGWAAISPTGRIYIYREQSFVKTKIEDWAPLVKQFIDVEQPRVIKFCKSAGQDRGTEHTVQQQISSALGIPVELTSNSPGSRVAGKVLLHEYLRWKPKPVISSKDVLIFSQEHASFLLRNQGLEAYKSYLKSFDPPEIESNIPKLQIFRCNEKDHEDHPNCCPLVIEAIKAANYAKPINGKPAEDVAEWEGDDPYDGVRYICDAAERFVVESQNEMAEAIKYDHIIKKFQETQDWTMLHRQMEHAESLNKNVSFGVRRRSVLNRRVRH